MNNLDSPRPRRHKRHPHSQSDFPPLLKYVIGIFMTNTTIVALLSFFSSSDTNVHPTLRQLSIVGTSAHSKPIFPSKIETEKMSRWSGVEWSSILVRCGFATRNMFGHRHQRYFNIGWWTGPSARTNGAALRNVLHESRRFYTVWCLLRTVDHLDSTYSASQCLWRTTPRHVTYRIVYWPDQSVENVLVLSQAESDLTKIKKISALMLFTLTEISMLHDRE